MKRKKTSIIGVSVSIVLLALTVALVAPPFEEQLLSIGGGRRLFLDDRLLDLSRCRDITRVQNPPQDIRRVFIPDRPWESLGFIFYANVLEDETEIKLYYTCYEWKDQTYVRHLCLATSTDGIHFERARLGEKTVNGTNLEVNILSPNAVECSIFLDPHASIENRYRMVFTDGGGIDCPSDGGLYTATSADGIRWKKNPTRLLPFIPDSQHAAFWDDHLRKYVVYLRAWAPKRSVCRIAVDDIDKPWAYDTSVPPFFIWGKDKTPTLSHELPVVLAPDEQDPANLDLYTSVAAPYPFAEEAYLAFPAAYFKLTDPTWKHLSLGGSDGLFEVQLATSPDGITWNRWRPPYVATGYHDGLDLRLVNMAQGMVRRGRWLYQYFVGWPHTHGQMGVWRNNPTEGDAWTKKDKGGLYLAKQRLDGFVSMDSAYSGGTLTTRPLLFTGNQLILNLNTHGTGNAKVTLMDKEGTPISGFTSNECEIIQTDDTDHLVRWIGGADIGTLAGRLIRVQVQMRNTKLYALQFTQAPLKD